MNNCTVNIECAAASAEEHARALNTHAWDIRRSDTESARRIAQQSMELCRNQLSKNPSSACWKHELGRALLILAMSNVRLSSYAVVQGLAEEAQAYFREVGYTTGQVYAITAMVGALAAIGGYDRAHALAEQGMALTAEVDDPEAVGTMMNVIGMISWMRSDYPQALDWFLKSLATMRSTNNRRATIDALNNLGMMYSSIGDYDKGLEHSSNALLLAREYEDRISEATALVNLGILHIQQDEMGKAKVYFVQALALNRLLASKNGQMHALINLASTELALGELASADEYVFEAIELIRNTGERRMESYALVVQGKLASARGEYDTAMEYYNRSLAIRRDMGYRLGEIETLATAAAMAIEFKRYPEAFSALHEALELAEEMQAKVWMFRLHEKLADVCELSGDAVQALQHIRQFYALQKEFFNEQAVIRQKSLQVYYEARQAAQEAEIYRLKNVELAAANAEILRQKQGLEEYSETIRRAHDQLLDKSIALEHLNRDKDEFIGIAVHGLKNPLSLIIMAASMLRLNSERMPKSELDKNLEWIELSAWRMEDLVLKLLQSNAIESGGMDCAPETIDVSSVLLPIVQEYDRLALAKGIRLVAEDAGHPLSVFADASMTRDIFDNLISNAVKFSPTDTTIRVRIFPDVEPKEDTNELSTPMRRIAVQDEGPGITEEDQERLFGKFERLSARPTGGEHSTGLGLSIVKRFVEIMGGRIWCESTPGNGAAFIVELPVAGVSQNTGAQ